MRVYNTLSKRVENFIPHDTNVVTMYTCGPTVYNYAHIGNLRTYIFEDVLERGLNYIGYKVKRVMNITDVGHLTSDGDTGEDKMIKGAKREGKTPQELAQFYTKAFFEDFELLNLNKPKIVEKASDHIFDYINVIKVLLDKKIAYLAGGNVYFDVSKANDYYKLSGKNEEDLIIGARKGVSYDDCKRNQFDFGLWFTKSKFNDQEQKWDSPWGIGYPGWHIECSTLAALYLGEFLDIHCGGVDNIFPHHTNEIAQSEAYFNHKWCNYWMHGEHLNDKDGKMSKSKGEFLTLNLLASNGYDPLSYKYFCLGSHYRKQLVFSYKSLDGAQNAYFKLKNRILKLKKNGIFEKSSFESYNKKFMDAISNDLNTSLMLTLLYDVLKDEGISDNTRIEILKSFDSVLGLSLFVNNKNSDVSEEYIYTQINIRNEAKKNKDYAKADLIRDELFNKGIKLIDTKNGTDFEII